jgi:hypothetical protein
MLEKVSRMDSGSAADCLPHYKPVDARKLLLMQDAVKLLAARGASWDS